MQTYTGPRIAGEYHSSVVILSLKRDAVQAMLPSELMLAPQDLTPLGEHPIVLSFNRQRHVALAWRALRGPPFSYLEFAVGVSYVQCMAGANRGPFFFAPLLYLNRLLPVLAGFLWGFAKEKTAIKSATNCYEVMDPGRDALRIAANFVPRGRPGHISEFPFFQNLLPLFKQPGIGRTIFGPFLRFDLEQNWERAQLQPVDANVRIDRPFLAGLPPGDYAASGIDTSPLGAYRLRTNWWLKLPRRLSH